MLQFSDTHIIFKKDTKIAHLTLTNPTNYPILYKVKANHIDAIHAHHNRGEIGPYRNKQLTFSKQIENIENLNLKVQINYTQSEEHLNSKQQFGRLWEKYGGKSAQQSIILFKQQSNPSIDRELNEGSFPFSENSMDTHRILKAHIESMQSIHEASSKAMKDEQIQKLKGEQRKKLQRKLKWYAKNHDIMRKSLDDIEHRLKLQERKPIARNERKANQHQPITLTTVCFALMIVFILGYLAGKSNQSES